MKICLIGCGDIGLRCAQHLHPHHQLTAVRRHINTLPTWLNARSADVTDPASLAWLEQLAPDVILYSLAASEFSPQAYEQAYVSGVQHCIDALGLSLTTLKRFVFVSSSGVYHQNDGCTVDEASATHPTRFNGQAMLRGEQKVQSTGVGTSVRFSGIYGPGRLRLIKRVQTADFTAAASDKLTNRIHVQDCAAILAHLIELSSTQSLENCYLASDNESAYASDVEKFIAKQLNIPYPATLPAQDTTVAGEVSVMPRIAGSKICDNRRLRNSGYEFIHPNFKSGYAALVDSLGG